MIKWSNSIHNFHRNLILVQLLSEGGVLERVMSVESRLFRLQYVNWRKFLLLAPDSQNWINIYNVAAEKEASSIANLISYRSLLPHDM